MGDELIVLLACGRARCDCVCVCVCACVMVVGDKVFDTKMCAGKSYKTF